MPTQVSAPPRTVTGTASSPFPRAAPKATHAPPPPDRASEFTPLLRSVRAAGLLERRTGWYARSIALNLLLVAATWTGVVLLGGSWWVLALALPAAVFGARTAFVGHDAGHQQIAASRRVNRVIGLVHADLLLGMSVGWWTDKHNRHHANPNHVDKDPDVGVGVLVWTQRQAAERAGFARWLTRHQAKLFFPLLLLEGVALKVSSLLDLRHRHGRERLVEGGLLALHLAGYATLLLVAMNPLQALAFASLHHALFGLHLGCAFAPNHKGMEMPDPDGPPLGHLRRQVLTSRNVRGSALTDFFLGGLNYQIDHHLFPNMPRPQLRAAQPLIRAHCAALGLPYTETGLVESYRQGLQHMHQVGAELR